MIQMYTITCPNFRIHITFTVVQFSDTWRLTQSNLNEPSSTLLSLATVVRRENYFLLLFPIEADRNQQQEKEFFSMNDIIILMMHYICLDWRHIWHTRFFRQHPLYGSCCVNIIIVLKLMPSTLHQHLTRCAQIVHSYQKPNLGYSNIIKNKRNRIICNVKK